MLKIEEQIRNLQRNISDLNQDIDTLCNFKKCNLCTKLEISKKTTLLKNISKKDFIDNFVKYFESPILNSCEKIIINEEKIALDIDDLSFIIPLDNQKKIIIKDNKYKILKIRDFYNIDDLKENIVELEKKYKSFLFSLNKKKIYKKHLETAKSRIENAIIENKKIEEQNQRVKERLAANKKFISKIKQDIKKFIDHGYEFDFYIGLNTEDIFKEIKK